MPDVLTDQTQVSCAHAAPATVVPSNLEVSAEQGRVLVESDVHMVTGCLFMIGTVSSPCIQIQWSSPARTTKVDKRAVLTNQSVGKCVAANGLPQGMALVSNSKKAKAQ